MILHLVSRSPFSDSSLEQCLTCLGKRDTLLLLQDAVVAVGHAHQWPARLLEFAPRVHVLRDDLLARGLSDAVAEGITEVDYHGFVRLTLQADAVCSWN